MEQRREIEIRNYERDQLESVVTLHETCFTKNDNFAMCFGHAFVCKTYQFFLSDKKTFGFVALCEGQVVGVLLGRLDYYTSALNAYRFHAAVKGLIHNPILLFNKRVMSKCIQIIRGKFFHRIYKKQLESAPSHQEGRTATLATFCIHPDFRDLRIGDKLLFHAEEVCRRNKMQFLRTGIQRENIASRFTFRSRGYIEDQVLSGDRDLLYYLPLNDNS